MLTLGLLAINLIAVMVDRWPWKRKHTPFLCAHVGILIILLGSIITMKYGLDGSMRIEIGRSSRYVTIPETEVVVFQSKNGNQYEEVQNIPVDFFLNTPSADKPVEIQVGEIKAKIVDFKPYVLPTKKVSATQDITMGSAVRFQIQNSQTQHADWLIQSHAMDSVSQALGLMRIHLGPPIEMGRGQNEIFLTPNGTFLEYYIFRKEQTTLWKKGKLQEGEQVKLDWMNFDFKILRYHIHAIEEWDIKEKETPSSLTTSAIKVTFQGQERWVLLNDWLRFNQMDALLRLAYANRRVPLSFDIRLKNFIIDRYQGLKKAMNYKSVVNVPGISGDMEISMNEPFKHKGLTFYQASFEEDDRGEPIATVLSVNHDPGRWLKYLGSLIMSIGIILLFYFRKYYLKNKPNH